jgi:hypothetical protein
MGFWLGGVGFKALVKVAGALDGVLAGSGVVAASENFVNPIYVIRKDVTSSTQACRSTFCIQHLSLR